MDGEMDMVMRFGRLGFHWSKVWAGFVWFNTPYGHQVQLGWLTVTLATEAVS